MDGTEWVATLAVVGTVVSGLGGALIGGRMSRRAALESAQLQLAHDREMRDREQADRLRERGAEVLGPAQTWLSDTAGMANGFQQPSTTELRELWERSQQIRAALDVFAAGHPSPEVANLARDLARHMMVVHYDIRHLDEGDPQSRATHLPGAIKIHSLAYETAERLVTAMREQDNEPTAVEIRRGRSKPAKGRNQPTA